MAIVIVASRPHTIALAHAACLIARLLLLSVGLFVWSAFVLSLCIVPVYVDQEGKSASGSRKNCIENTVESSRLDDWLNLAPNYFHLTNSFLMQMFVF